MNEEIFFRVIDEAQRRSLMRKVIRALPAEDQHPTHQKQAEVIRWAPPQVMVEDEATIALEL